MDKQAILRGAKLQDELVNDLKRAVRGYDARPKTLRGKDMNRHSQTKDPAVDKPNQDDKGTGLPYYMAKAKKHDNN